MADFPVLRSGAVAQYPLGFQTQFATDVVKFLDGSEQRFRRYAGKLRRWTVRLDLLDEGEMAAVVEFFRSHRGVAGTFRFTDPADGTAYEQCRFASDSIRTVTDARGRGAVVVAIQEMRS